MKKCGPPNLFQKFKPFCPSNAHYLSDPSGTKRPPKSAFPTNFWRKPTPVIARYPSTNHSGRDLQYEFSTQCRVIQRNNWIFDLLTIYKHPNPLETLCSFQEDTNCAQDKTDGKNSQAPLRDHTSRVSFRLHAIPGTACPGLCGSSRLPLPPPSVVGRGQLCRRIHIAR